MRKAQSSIEFITLIGFAVAGFIILLMAFETQMINTERNIDFTRSEEVFNIVQEEIRFAYNSPYNYKRSFELPPSINGEEYELEFSDSVEVALQIKGNDYVYFLSHEVEGDTLNIGTNTIQKYCELGECTLYLNEEPDQTVTAINNCNSLRAMTSDGHYVLSNNINCADTINWNEGEGFEPISPFSGTFDGQGRVISNLFINRTENRQGLFGTLDGATVRNVGIVDAYVRGGNENVGILAGYVQGNSHMNNIYTEGEVNTVEWKVGGVIGTLASGLLEKAYSESIVTADAYVAGGLIGFLEENGMINNSYKRGSVSTTEVVGGLVGLNDGGLILNVYVSDETTLSGTNYVGGLVGIHRNEEASIINSYSAGQITAIGTTYGGLIGSLETGASITNSYWDNETSGVSTSMGGEGKTTSDMQNITTFVDWNISSSEDYTNEIWVIEENSYPLLAWQR